MFFFNEQKFALYNKKFRQIKVYIKITLVASEDGKFVYQTDIFKSVEASWIHVVQLM